MERRELLLYSDFGFRSFIVLVYPKVRVRAQGHDDSTQEYNWSSLLSLKDIQFLSLQDDSSPVKRQQDFSPPPIAKIAESYVPSMVVPTVSVSEANKKNDIGEEDRPNIRACSIPRPRAVLSSPDNDAVIGNNNRIKAARQSPLKNRKLIQSRREQHKVIPSQIVDASPINTRKSKNSSDHKSEHKLNTGSRMAVSSQRRKITSDKPTCMRF